MVEQQLLEAHFPVLLEKGFDALMAEERVEDLTRLYNLAGRIQTLEAVKQALRQYVRSAGSALIMDEEKARAPAGYPAEDASTVFWFQRFLPPRSVRLSKSLADITRDAGGYECV